MASKKPDLLPAAGGERQRCVAKAKSSGRRCARWAVPGSTVCRTHGGAAPQVIAAAKRRLLAVEAGAELARLGVAIETTPVEALEAMLYEAAGNVAVLRMMVAELGQHHLYGDLYHQSGSPTGEAKPHVLVVMYNEERDRLAKLAEACAKLGLDERKVRIAETEVGRLFDHVTGAIADCGLTAEQTQAFKKALAARIRGGQ